MLVRTAAKLSKSIRVFLMLMLVFSEDIVDISVKCSLNG